MSTTPATPASDRQRDWAWVLGLGACSAALTVHPVHESDPFWQMTLGRAVLETGAREFPEPVAFTEFTNPAVVPEWLWSVATHVLHASWGWPALSLLLGFTAVAAAVAVAKLSRAYAADAPRLAVAAVSLLALVLVSSRMRLRPQAAFMVLLPVFMVAAHRYACASGRARVRLGCVLVLLEAVWAQLHGSFVLGPAVFGLVVAPQLLLRPTREAWLQHGLFGLGVALAIFTSAHGLDTVGYVLAHSGSDAAQHMQDMRPPTWGSFDPTASPYAAAYLALWGVALAGAVFARRVDPSALGLALLGVAVLSTANRFFAAAGLLALPLAAQGAAALTASPWRPAVRLAGAASAAAAALLLVWSGGVIDHLYGPLGRTGLAADAHPRAAAAFLAEAPDGARVLSAMSASGPLGYWLEGRVRTYLDARTPLYFDDADFGVARELWANDDALARGLAHFAPWAVVVERDTKACTSMDALSARGWVPAVVEARFTTFVPGERGPGLEAIAPCGEAYLQEDACREGGSVLGRDLARLGGLPDEPFPAYLAAEHALRCRGDADTAESLLPPPADARSFRNAQATLAGRIAVARGDWALALAMLGPRARAGDVEALNLLGGAMQTQDGARDLRRVLDDAMAAWGDTAPPDLRANLALLCTTLRDAECVRFHGLRAAARGVVRVAPALHWLAENHPDPRARRDAQRWSATLAASPETRLARGAD